jgi:antitoxin ParD1/3/4
MSVNVNLTPYLEAMVRQKVQSGRYSSVSEVVREALRLMDAQDACKASINKPLQQEIRAGLESGAAEPWDVEEFKKSAKARRQTGKQGG